uniref:UQCR10 n=1 Tax=Euglena gracilis TaxID=3039 RepID=UPI002FE4FABA
MALEIKREWHVVPATKKFADVPTEWPAKEHERFALPYGPSEGRIVSFMRASRIRNRLLFTLNPTGYTEDTYVTKEALRRQALAESKNLWYLPERPVVADQLETIVNRSTFFVVKGHKNKGLIGIAGARHNPLVWLPTLALGGVWAWRWASAGTI